jgi:RNA polymerase sigma-70 factor (ECF subfamily)
MDGLSPEILTRLWTDYRAALVLYARQWCDGPEDVVQDAFLLLARQPNAPENPVGWLYRVVRNRAINAARSGARQSRRETAAASQARPWFEAGADDRLDAEAATGALKELPADQREAIVARLWGGLSFEEIARLSGVSLSAAYRSYHRGLATLRERLGWSCPANKATTKT